MAANTSINEIINSLSTDEIAALAEDLLLDVQEIATLYPKKKTEPRVDDRGDSYFSVYVDFDEDIQTLKHLSSSREETVDIRGKQKKVHINSYLGEQEYEFILDGHRFMSVGEPNRKNVVAVTFKKPANTSAISKTAVTSKLDALRQRLDLAKESK